MKETSPYFYLWTSSRRQLRALLFSICMPVLFNILAIVQIAAGLFLLWQGLQWLAYVRRRLGTDPGFYAPLTAVICPCRGMEPGRFGSLGRSRAMGQSFAVRS